MDKNRKRKKLNRRVLFQVAVLGSDADLCSKNAYRIAEDVGKELGNAGFVVITGGGSGVMEAACKGAKKAGALTVGILFGQDKAEANPYCDIIIPTGLGFARDSINAYSADAVVLVEGGVGTLSEATYAYFDDIPIIAMVESGGIAHKYAGKFLDKRRTERIIPAHSAKEAVDTIMRKVKFSEKRFKFINCHVD
jgi:hypothetical protein